MRPLTTSIVTATNDERRLRTEIVKPPGVPVRPAKAHALPALLASTASVVGSSDANRALRFSLPPTEAVATKLALANPSSSTAASDSHRNAAAIRPKPTPADLGLRPPHGQDAFMALCGASQTAVASTPEPRTHLDQLQHGCECRRTDEQKDGRTADNVATSRDGRSRLALRGWTGCSIDGAHGLAQHRRRCGAYHR